MRTWLLWCADVPHTRRSSDLAAPDVKRAVKEAVVLEAQKTIDQILSPGNSQSFGEFDCSVKFPGRIASSMASTKAFRTHSRMCTTLSFFLFGTSPRSLKSNAI